MLPTAMSNKERFQALQKVITWRLKAALTNVHIRTLGSCDDVALHDKGNLADGIIRTLRWEVPLDSPGGPLSSQGPPKREVGGSEEGCAAALKTEEGP